MKISTSRSLFVCTCSLLISSLSAQVTVPAADTLSQYPAPAAAPAAYERPHTVAASSLISSDFLTGPGYRVAPDADPNGMLYSFNIASNYGPMQPQSLQMLRVRLAEMKALARLQQLSEEHLYLQGAGKQLESTVQATGMFIMHPIKTLKQVPVGFKKFAGQIQAQQTVGQVYGEQGSPTYSQLKRELAARLGVDPYTDNQPLQDLLNKVAQNRNRGRLVASIGTFVLGGGLGVAANMAEMNQEFNEVIRNKSAAQLQLDNRAALMNLGATQHRADYFLTTPGYTASNCTAIVRALVTLGKVKNVLGVLDVLPTFAGPESILFGQTQVQMAAQFHATRRPLTSVQYIQGTAVWADASGNHYVFSPLEYLYWNEEIDIGMSNIRREIGPGTMELWIAGTATSTASSELAARGITVRKDTLTTLW